MASKKKESAPVPVPIQDELEELEIRLLLEGVHRRYGYDFRQYTPASLRRRIRRMVHNENVSSTTALLDRVIRDPRCMRRLIDTLAVHVTAMFRDPPFYRALREHVVPLLRTFPFLRVWHAGCSTGEEVYSLAILLEEEGLYDRCRIYATDLSDSLLERARRGIFPLPAMREYTENYIRGGGKHEFSKYYRADREHVIFASSIKRNMVFSQHDLAVDGSFNEFQLVLCRNVMIYFDDTLRERVQDLLYQSLSLSGVLGLGMKESVRYWPLGDRFEDLPGDARLYRRHR